jgi:hypothetical protein
MRNPLLSITALFAGVVCMCLVPAKAAPQLRMLGIAAKVQARAVEDVGYRRRYYRRYRPPYAYYPPAYGYYYPPPAYGYYYPPPAYGYYAPYRYYRPYAPYY